MVGNLAIQIFGICSNPAMHSRAVTGFVPGTKVTYDSFLLGVTGTVSRRAYCRAGTAAMVPARVSGSWEIKK